MYPRQKRFLCLALEILLATDGSSPERPNHDQRQFWMRCLIQALSNNHFEWRPAIHYASLIQRLVEVLSPQRATELILSCPELFIIHNCYDLQIGTLSKEYKKDTRLLTISIIAISREREVLLSRTICKKEEERLKL